MQGLTINMSELLTFCSSLTIAFCSFVFSELQRFSVLLKIVRKEKAEALGNTKCLINSKLIGENWRDQYKEFSVFEGLQDWSLTTLNPRPCVNFSFLVLQTLTILLINWFGGNNVIHFVNWEDRVNWIKPPAAPPLHLISCF